MSRFEVGLLLLESAPRFASWSVRGALGANRGLLGAGWSFKGLGGDLNFRARRAKGCVTVVTGRSATEGGCRNIIC